MLRAEHYREAERLLARAHSFVRDATEHSMMLAEAQVHATLAACPIEGGYPNNYGAEE